MANEEHLAILKKGVEAWNRWRTENPNVLPDLSGADLSSQYLAKFNLARADLTRTNLAWATLTNSTLDFAVLVGSLLHEARLMAASAASANLAGAEMSGAVFDGTILSGASLEGATLFSTIFNGAYLDNTDLTASLLDHARFDDVDLSAAKGLESVAHLGPSSIGIDTIYESRGKIPEVFLRGAGVPEPFIANMKALVAAMEPIQFYSCFISYSSRDQEFAERLYADLQSKNVRCWFAPEDMKIGDRIRPRIDEAIRVHDKLLLVLTESSMKSAWVEKEVETAFEKERKQGRTVLFPIRLDDAVMEADEAWAADIRRTQHIGDFCGWKEHDRYKKAFERLMRDLKAEK